MDERLIRPVAPCFVSHNLALGGAQTAVLRWISCMPEWVRDRTTLYCQSDDMPLLDHAVEKHGFQVARITTDPPDDPSCWVLSYGNLEGLPQRPTSLFLHSWDDAGWRYITRTYDAMHGMTVAGVSNKVLHRYHDWIRQGGHSVAGVLPPPATEFTICKGPLSHRRGGDHIVVAWMGRPLKSKGLMSLPYLLKRDPRIVVRAWTGAETGKNLHTCRSQAQVLEELMDLARDLGVAHRLDLRPLDFDALSYRHRLEGAHVLLGNSQNEGFLMTAAEALSCGIPVVVTRSCGVSDFVTEGVNGCLIEWEDDPKRLARVCHKAVRRAAKLDPMACLQSARNLSVRGSYREVYGATLDRMTHTNLQASHPRVTIGVRIHKGMDVQSLDEAISSIAGQTYRAFKVVLLVDGPWSYGDALARRYDLPLICTGLEPDITQCSWLHRQAVEHCDTEFYKPLDYDDQLLPNFLSRAVRMIDQHDVDVYGCLLMTLQDGQLSPRLHWPSRPIETMFTGNSDHNQLPHSSVMMRTDIARAAGNYQERAVGLGADDYHLWYRIFKSGGRFFRDDDVRNVVYRIHEKNSLNIRRKRYGGTGRFIAGATAAALAPAPSIGLSPPASGQTSKGPSKGSTADSGKGESAKPAPVDPPHS